MIDYVFRYDPSQPNVRPTPANAEEARKTLIEGNRTFSEWMSTCRLGEKHEGGCQYIIPFGGPSSSFVNPGDEYPTQSPFAAVLGCSDARVPTEMLFGQGFNNLFVIRVAGNVLGDPVQGSIDFSVAALSKSVRVLVSLGHTNCGAVKGAVENYLDPQKFWSKTYSTALRSIFQEIFVDVRESDNALRAVWGADAPKQPRYREALTDMAICLNAAHTALSLRQQVREVERPEIGVLYGVYDIRSHQVCMPLPPGGEYSPDNVNLALAPEDPTELASLATQLATSYRGS